jgi:hypothetical protein
MNIGKLTTSANNQAEESFSSSQVMEFVNDAIARVNIECSANFPFMDTTDAEYTGLPEKWQRALFLPFVIGRMKQVDASQFEYSDSFAEFQSNLITFKTKYSIPDEYRDTKDKVSFTPDFTGNPWGWN